MGPRGRARSDISSPPAQNGPKPPAGPRGAPKRPQEASVRPLRRPQDAPKASPRGPKESPSRPPRGISSGFNMIQDASAENAPQEPREGSRRTLQRPPTSQSVVFPWVSERCSLPCLLSFQIAYDGPTSLQNASTLPTEGARNRPRARQQEPRDVPSVPPEGLPTAQKGP